MIEDQDSDSMRIALHSSAEAQKQDNSLKSALQILKILIEDVQREIK
jgi:hypothetical protein